MSGALVVFEHEFPVNRGHKPMVPAVFSDRPALFAEALPGMNPEPGRSDWIMFENKTGAYGPDARMISTVPAGLIVDIYA